MCLYPSHLRPWGRSQAKAFVAQLGRRITRFTGDVRETDFLRQRLSVAIQRGKALAIRGSLGFQKDIDLDGPLDWTVAFVFNLSMNMFLSSNLCINRVYILICVLYELSMIVNVSLQNTLFSLHLSVFWFYVIIVVRIMNYMNLYSHKVLHKSKVLGEKRKKCLKSIFGKSLKFWINHLNVLRSCASTLLRNYAFTLLFFYAFIFWRSFLT